MRGAECTCEGDQAEAEHLQGTTIDYKHCGVEWINTADIKQTPDTTAGQIIIRF